MKLVEQYDALGWNPQIRDYCKEVKANFWSKNDKDGLDKVKAFIEKDPHLDTLERHLGKTQKELFAKVLQTRDDEDLIETNLANLRTVQQKMLEKLANDVRPFLSMGNRHLRNGNLNIRGSLRWLNDNPNSFYIKQNDVKNWDSLFDVLKDRSDIISERIYELLHPASQQRILNWNRDGNIESLKGHIVRGLNTIIDRKDFLSLTLSLKMI